VDQREIPLLTAALSDSNPPMDFSQDTVSDVPGIITRKIGDCLDIFNTIAVPDPFDSTTVKQKFYSISLPNDVDVK
jgi:Asp-tRNA(Asn)/Glu-tRNA(Gln) amidotransferase A subunit family amidase